MDILKIVTAVIFSIASGGTLVFALSSWLGKVWANRILESDRSKYQKEMDALRAGYELQLKRYEIKASAIQKELNQVVLKLAPALSRAFSHCYVFAEVAPRGFPQDALDVHRKISSESLSILWDELRAAQLLLSDGLSQRIDSFQRELWRIRKAVSDSTYSGDHDPQTGLRIEKSDLQTLFESVKKLEPEERAIINCFCDVIGTNPAKMA
jgi:hypothetical protein